MKIVKVIGGLGNQMFQFALYKALQKQFPEERVLLDLHTFKGYHKHRGFELPKVFGACYEAATLSEVARIAYPYPDFQCWRWGSRLLPGRKTMLREKPDFTYEPTALTHKGSLYYDGYWQHEEYFIGIREQLLDIFRFPDFPDERNRQMALRISQQDSCALHIRRGDYLSDKLRKDTAGLSYATEAVRQMRGIKRPNLWCVFSDDIAWCREHLTEAMEGEETCYIDWNTGADSIHDMHLMALCHHQIIANSSFSWWAAWLNRYDEKTVIAPEKWMALPGAVSPVPHDWIRINPQQPAK